MTGGKKRPRAASSADKSASTAAMRSLNLSISDDQLWGGFDELRWCRRSYPAQHFPQAFVGFRACDCENDSPSEEVILGPNAAQFVGC